MGSPKHRLADEVRRLLEAVALLDPVADVGELTEQVSRAADTAASLPALGGLAATGQALEERSPLSGRANPLAAPMTITVDGDVTRGTAVYGAAYEGPEDTLHGGFVAAAFDDLLGVAQMASGSAGFTGTITVKMRRPTPLRTRIDYQAGVREVRGRKITCWGKSFADGELVAEAECLFVTPKDGQVR